MTPCPSCTVVLACSLKVSGRHILLCTGVLRSWSLQRAAILIQAKLDAIEK